MKPSQKLDHCAGINIKTSCYLPSMHAYLQLTSAKFRINVIVRKVLRKFAIMSSISDTFMYALPNIFKLCEKNTRFCPLFMHGHVLKRVRKVS